jgi:uncharacterized membrane protein HdeD (DUF308 family)
MTNLDTGSLRSRIETRVREHRFKYILQGLMFITAGCLAAAIPTLAALHLAFMIGAVLLATGILQFVLTLQSKMHWWSLLSALLSVVTGALILWQPFSVLLAFVSCIVIFLTLEGIFEIFLALQMRPARAWRWMLCSGCIALGLAAVTLIGYPTFDTLYLGYMIATNLMLYGISLLMLVWRTDE